MTEIKYAHIFYSDENGESHVVGHSGVTRITMADKKGPMDFVPYVQIWKGEHLHAEYALHNIVGIEYAPA